MSKKIDKIDKIDKIKELEVENIETPDTDKLNLISFEELKNKLSTPLPISEILTIKKYLPIMHKEVCINDIKLMSTDYDENGMAKINYCSLELFKTVKIIEFYTNYKFSDDRIVEEYDYMIENGIVDEIYNAIGNLEMYKFDSLLQNELKQNIKASNSIETVINTHLYMFQDKVDMLIKKIPNLDQGFINKSINKMVNAVKGFSPEKYSELKKMTEFVQGEKTDV